jgi:hypothetical protein
MATTPKRGLFGLSHTNIDFSRKGVGGWGKNKFNNAFPIALLCYMDSQGLDLPLIEAGISEGVPCIQRSRIRVADVYGASPTSCEFEFEGVFSPFEPFVAGTPNKSDVIVHKREGSPVRALEIKLTVVPDQTTLKFPRAAQASEFVTRPLMVELLATNICMAYGPTGRSRLNDLLLEGLGNPNNWSWQQSREIYPRLGKVRRALELIITDSRDRQTPMVVQPIWRTVGDSMRLDENCFDAFVWTDFGLALLYLQSVIKNIDSPDTGSKISREARSAVWLVKMLWDYSTAGQLTMSEVIKQIAYGNQQDKAGSFSGKVMLDYMQGAELTNPRITKSELPKIILNGGEEYLNPERRLDATLFMETTVAKRGAI